jgi:hypothetical protein
VCVCVCVGLACLSLGCDVLFTDLTALLPYTEGNIRRNCATVVQSRARVVAQHVSECDSERVSECVSECVRAELDRGSCDTAPLWFGPVDTLPSRVVHLASRRAHSLCVLCSECVFRTELHTPLAQTLHALLSLHRDAQKECASECVSECASECVSECVSATVMVGFILREHEDMRFITHSCVEYGLLTARVPPSEITDLLVHAAWNSTDLLPHNCHVYSITLTPS